MYTQTFAPCPFDHCIVPFVMESKYVDYDEKTDPVKPHDCVGAPSSALYRLDLPILYQGR